MLRLFSTGVVTLGCCRATGRCGAVEGAVEKVLVHLVVVYELVLRGRRSEDRDMFVLLLDGEKVCRPCPIPVMRRFTGKPELRWI